MLVLINYTYYNSNIKEMQHEFNNRHEKRNEGELENEECISNRWNWFFSRMDN